MWIKKYTDFYNCPLLHFLLWIDVTLLKSTTWATCLEELERKIPQQEYNTWIKPLQIEEKPGLFRILAPNDFVYDALEEKYLIRIKEFLAASGYDKGEVILEVGSLEQ